ncbi:MAG: hypothetical protein NZ820_12705 [Dehalococcoidia bacterium]|nr:hypothetical protein [Dehalococcoidia bacterium]
MTEDNLSSILSSKKRKPSRFPVGSHHGGLGQVEKRLEFYIWKQRIPPFSSNEPINSRKFKEDEQRHETEFLTENVSYLSKDIQYKSQRVRVRREEEELRKMIENIKQGKFP